MFSSYLNGSARYQDSISIVRFPKISRASNSASSSWSKRLRRELRGALCAPHSVTDKPSQCAVPCAYARSRLVLGSRATSTTSMLDDRAWTNFSLQVLDRRHHLQRPNRSIDVHHLVSDWSRHVLGSQLYFLITIGLCSYTSVRPFQSIAGYGIAPDTPECCYISHMYNQ